MTMKFQKEGSCPTCKRAIDLAPAQAEYEHNPNYYDNAHGYLAPMCSECRCEFVSDGYVQPVTCPLVLTIKADSAILSGNF